MRKYFYKTVDKFCMKMWGFGDFVSNLGMKITFHALSTSDRFNDRRLYGKR